MIPVTRELDVGMWRADNTRPTALGRRSRVVLQVRDQTIWNCVCSHQVLDVESADSVSRLWPSDSLDSIYERLLWFCSRHQFLVRVNNRTCVPLTTPMSKTMNQEICIRLLQPCNDPFTIQNVENFSG